MKKFAVLAIAALVAGSAFADGGLCNSYVYVDSLGWYQGSGLEWWDGAVKGAFEDADLGEYSITSSILIGGQVQAWENNGGDNIQWGSDSAMTLNYSIDNGTAQTASLPWYGFTGNPGGNNQFQSGGNDFDNNKVSVSLAGLSNGEHSLSVWFTAPEDKGWGQDGAYTAKFNVTGGSTAVPEPATMSLLGLGALAMVIRRKLSK